MFEKPNKESGNQGEDDRAMEFGRGMRELFAEEQESEGPDPSRPAVELDQGAGSGDLSDLNTATENFRHNKIWVASELEFKRPDPAGSPTKAQLINVRGPVSVAQGENLYFFWRNPGIGQNPDCPFVRLTAFATKGMEIKDGEDANLELNRNARAEAFVKLSEREPSPTLLGHGLIPMGHGLTLEAQEKLEIRGENWSVKAKAQRSK